MRGVLSDILRESEAHLSMSRTSAVGGLGEGSGPSLMAARQRACAGGCASLGSKGSGCSRSELDSQFELPQRLN